MDRKRGLNGRNAWLKWKPIWEEMQSDNYDNNHRGGRLPDVAAA